jgi:hypothetical protein
MKELVSYDASKERNKQKPSESTCPHFPTVSTDHSAVSHVQPRGNNIVSKLAIFSADNGSFPVISKLV